MCVYEREYVCMCVCVRVFVSKHYTSTDIIIKSTGTSIFTYQPI